MNKKLWMYLEVIMLIVWIVTTFIFCYAVFSKSAKCTANPLVYGVSELQDKNNVTFTCKCQFENQLDKIIFVDSKHWEFRDNKFIGG